MRNEQPEEVPRGSSATQQGSKSRLRPTAIMSRRSHSFRLRAVRGFEEAVSDTRKHATSHRHFKSVFSVFVKVVCVWNIFAIKKTLCVTVQCRLWEDGRYLRYRLHVEPP